MAVMNRELFDQKPLKAPNVATVPQYSPFRYPGGKSRHIPIARAWLADCEDTDTLIEPFAGGSHIGLAAAIESMVEQVVLVELDENVAAVWKTILEGDVDWLLEQIQTFEVTHDNVEDLFERREESPKIRAFAMLVHNRISRGGITSPGAGVMNKGEKGKGLTSRWYPDTLVTRIEKIRASKDQIEIVQGDGLAVMKDYQNDPSAAFFIDPPYPKAGGRLYTHSDVDHGEIFRICSEADPRCLITYDNSDEIQDLVEKYGFDSEKIIMSNTHHEEKYELLIGRDMSWL